VTVVEKVLALDEYENEPPRVELKAIGPASELQLLSQVTVSPA
jgi:hypothetical protein